MGGGKDGIGPRAHLPGGSRAAGNAVTFGPGARIAWLTHPLRQIYIVTFGAGLVQREGGAVEVVHPSDGAWFAAAEKHWLGATATMAMQHSAVSEEFDGAVVGWLEHVSDEEYAEGTPT